MSELENDNIKASILVFPGTLRGIIPFYLINEIPLINNRISLSVAISILLKKSSNETLMLKLVRCQKKEGRFQGKNLQSISLGDCNKDNTKHHELIINDDEQICDDYRYCLYYTFSINNISVIGPGTYAIALVKEEIGYLKTLATYYFEVKEQNQNIII